MHSGFTTFSSKPTGVTLGRGYPPLYRQKMEGCTASFFEERLPARCDVVGV